MKSGKMNITVLKRLLQTLSSTNRVKYNSHLKCLSTLHRPNILVSPSRNIKHQRTGHHSVSHGLTFLSVPVSSRLYCRRVSVDMKNVFRDDEDGDGDSTSDIQEKRSDRILGSKSLVEFKHRCSDLELRMSPKAWQDLEEQVLAENPRAEKAFEATCMRLMYAARNMELPESFISYIRSKGSSPNLATLTTFIAMCGTCCGKQKQELLYQAYDELLNITDLFDSMATKYLILGFSCTDRWRECLEFIEMTKLSSRLTAGYYCPVVSAALREGDTELALSLLTLMGDEGFRPMEQVFQDLVKKIRESRSQISINVFMDYLRKYHWLISQETAAMLEEYFKSHENRRYRSKFSRVNKWGVCQSCKQPLKRLQLSDAEFEKLQRDILENALIGENVYLQSNPAEVERFKEFVQENAPFDVVIDALNVAYRNSTERKPNSFFLKRVVEHFARVQHQRVLVIGRQHMKGWPAKNMRPIEEMARTFYTENISKDDPFSLYAAMYSGKSCLILSEDHMKDHKFRLGAHMKEVFEQWQRSHQITDYYSIDRGRIFVKMPPKHETGPQEDEKGWHIPFEDESERAVYLRPDTWLCVRDLGLKSMKNMSQRD